jgi:sphingomyelin phosphodiesterase 2
MGDRLDYIFSTLACESSTVVLTECIPKTDVSFSDHFGVHSRFRVTPLKQGSVPVVSEMLQVLQSDHARSVIRTQRLLGLFVSSVVLVVTLLVLVWFFPYPWIALLVCLLSVVATIALIVGFVFGNMEQRSLEQYMMDMSFCMNKDGFY